MANIISDYLEPVSYFTYLGSIFSYSRNKPRNFRYKILLGYYFIGGVLLFIATLLTSNIVIYDFMFLLTSVSLAVYFYSSLQSAWKKLITVWICFTEVIYYVLNNLVYKASPLFDSTGYAILSTGMVIMIFMFMHQILTNVSDKSLSLNFEFWFVASLMIYFLGSFVIFLTFNYLTRKILPSELYSYENRDLLNAVWGVHNVLLFLGALLTLGSVLWISYHKKSPSS